MVTHLTIGISWATLLLPLQSFYFVAQIVERIHYTTVVSRLRKPKPTAYLVTLTFSGFWKQWMVLFGLAWLDNKTHFISATIDKLSESVRRE